MKSTLRIALLLLLGLVVSATMADSPDDSEFPALRDCRDPELQRGIDQVVARLGLQQAVARKELALAVTDITDLYTARFGAPTVGSKVYVQVNQFVDGWESLPRTFVGIVPEAS